METMKQGTALRCGKLSGLFTEEEVEVAQLLVDLKTTIPNCESRFQKFTWGCKRKRSSLGVDPPSPSPSVQKSDEEIELKNTQFKLDDDSAAAASPDTPLSFSPSESDEKPRHPNNKGVKKRSREEYIELIEEFTRTRNLLRTEVEKVRNYYNEKKVENAELKAKKQEMLKSVHGKEEIQKTEISNAMDRLHYRITVLPHHHHHQPFGTDQKFQYSLGPITAQLYRCTNNGPGIINLVGPVGIPDLNVSAEEAFGIVDPSQPLNMGQAIADRRARFAEARRLRKGIIKINKIRSACGVKLPRLR